MNVLAQDGLTQARISDERAADAEQRDGRRPAAPDAGTTADVTAEPGARAVRPLTRDFLTWVASAPRTYEDVMETWRTSCPRLAIWEDALDDGLIQLDRRDGAAGPATVTLTPEGRTVLGS